MAETADQNSRALRRALGQFATGVAVITAEAADGSVIGLTMSSFNSVSMDPPLVLFSIDRKAFSLAAMSEAKGYAVNILGSDQEHLSNKFAKALGDKWTAVEHTLGYCAAPLLAGALAHFECEPYAQYDGGDHVIFVGRVVRFAAETTSDPLIFFRGSYRGLAKQERSPQWPLPMHY
ncbi:oxygenase [Afipia sp. Root123D2]|uniref:flavin reductase family protein n=1 Tax=Afipia sp. Root123D2 TaxID=1736436 RepID=UPI0006FE898F|nr:flavin reductase family protein [Afipia sp. Root123D2]KQW20542.1 oxygenase [Afipia sp. Root123D2]